MVMILVLIMMTLHPQVFNEKNAIVGSPKFITNGIVRSLDHQRQSQSKKISNTLLILCIQVILSRELK